MNDDRLPLFRAEALDSVRPRTLGDVVIVHPPSLRLLTLAAAALGAVIASLLMWGRYTPQIELSGHLALRLESAQVSSPVAGTIVDQNASEGDNVTVGQVLYVVLPDVTGAIPMAAGGIREASTKNFAIRSPVDGTITSTHVGIGERINDQQSLLNIAPDDAVLEARLLAPSRVIGKLRPGNEVVLRYDAYPYYNFGHQRGTLRSVARTPVVGSEVVIGPRPAGEAYYIVRVDLPSQSVFSGKEVHALRAGLTVMAVIPHDSRRLYELMLAR